MYARVVRFTEVTAERISEIVAQVEESEGPPPGVDSTGSSCLSTKHRERPSSSDTSTRSRRCATRARSSNRWTRRRPPARGPPLTSARSRYSAPCPEGSTTVRGEWLVSAVAPRDEQHRLRVQVAERTHFCFPCRAGAPAASARRPMQKRLGQPGRRVLNTTCDRLPVRRGARAAVSRRGQRGQLQSDVVALSA
jgi:hypothetical protein